MIDQYIPSLLERAPKRYKYIIIHDTSCQNDTNGMFKIDKKMFQTGAMRSRFRSIKNYYDMPYHFVCERIGQNYQTVVGRPLQYSCYKAYPDIDRHYAQNAIHICLMGDYNVLSHSIKLYQQLAYRVICPMMKTFKINRSRVYLHGELSKKHSDCPGFNFNKNLLLAYMSKFLMGVPS